MAAGRSELHVELVAPGVGHDGVFSGRRWERRIDPAVRDFVGSAQ